MRKTVVRALTSVVRADHNLANHMASVHHLVHDGDAEEENPWKWTEMKEEDLTCCFCSKKFDKIATLNAHITWRDLVEPPTCDHKVVCR